MEEQVRQYFEELDPEKRKALLEEIDKDKASFRRELYKKALNSDVNLTVSQICGFSNASTCQDCTVASF